MKVALIGYGKMGKAIEEVLRLQGNKDDRVVLKITDENRNDLCIENLQQADVAIEFTQPHAAVQNILSCFEAGVPVVCGTTGWYYRLPEVRQICEKHRGALLYSPNFSIGVNLFFEWCRQAAVIMNRHPQYAAAIQEIHHTEKLDQPSGTAIRLAEIVLQELSRYSGWALTEDAATPNGTLPVTALRQPQVPGTHTLSFSSPADTIQLTHTAHNRTGFAQGAVAAARWLIGRQGVFEMADLLNTPAM